MTTLRIIDERDSGNVKRRKRRNTNENRLRSTWRRKG
jgi:hypothetical protein